jgi:hypothetical protein
MEIAMQEGISTRARIAILIYSMTNAVLFGIGVRCTLGVASPAVIRLGVLRSSGY